VRTNILKMFLGPQLLSRFLCVRKRVKQLNQVLKCNGMNLVPLQEASMLLWVCLLEAGESRSQESAPSLRREPDYC
jgi:hypothetical protein